MTNRYLISVAAAALIAGTSFATAQTPSTTGGSPRDVPAAGSTAQQAPSTAAPAVKSSEQSAPKGSDSQMKASDSSDKAGAKTTQTQDKSKVITTDNDAAKANKDMKAGDKGGAPSTNAQTKSTTDSNVNAQTKSSTDAKSQTTTGNAATSATAAPPAEKRTQIVNAIRSEKIEDVGASVNVNITLGATLPSTVRFYPLPARIVEIYPEWRGYEVVLIKGRYVIVRPQTREIVYIIEG